MTTQLIRIDNQIINLQLITSVTHTETHTWIHFDHDNASLVLDGENAKLVWEFLRSASLRIGPTKSPQLPVWDAAK